MSELQTPDALTESELELINDFRRLGSDAKKEALLDVLFHLRYAEPNEIIVDVQGLKKR